MKSTMMGLLLQPEVLEKIFSFLDGRTLIRVAQVDKTWNQEVKRIAKNSRTWHAFIKEIPKTILIELTTNLDLHLPLPDTDNLPEACLLRSWRSVYINWWLWTRISKWTTSLSSFCIGESVTCAKLSGCCIVTGHSSGEIRVWNLRGRLLAVCRTHGSAVENLLLVALGSDFKFENFEWCNTYPRPNLGSAHHCVISTSTDAQLAVTYFVGSSITSKVLKLHRPDYLIHRVKLISGDLSSVVAARVIPTTANILVVRKNGIIYTGTIYLAKIGPENKLVLDVENTFEFPGSVFCKTISCHPPKTISAVVTLNNMQSFYCINWEEEFEWSTLAPLCQPSHFMQDVKIFRANICIWVENSVRTLLHIYTNDIIVNFTKYEVRPTLPAVPICFHLHGPVLFMGTSTGSLMAFDARKLPKLDLGEPLWSMHLNCGPIKAIHVLGGHNELRLVAVGGTLVHYIVFETSHCMSFLSY